MNLKKLFFNRLIGILFVGIVFFLPKVYSQCGTATCSVCNVGLTINNVTNGTVVTGESTISGTIGPGTTVTGTGLEINASDCGVISIEAVLSFSWSQGNANSWMHGISISNSPNWTLDTGTNIGAGWNGLNSITGDCSVLTYGAGFYWDSDSNDGTSNCQTTGDVAGDPSDNYGLPASSCCPSFLLKLEYCPTTTGTTTSAFDIKITEDGQSGGWALSSGCEFDLLFPVTFNNQGSTLPATTGPICAGEIVDLDAGIGCSSYLWNNGETTPTIQVFPSITTTYCVTVSSGLACQTTACSEVIVEQCCEAMAGSVTTDCNGDTPNVTITGFNSSSGYAQYILLVDAGGIIQEILNGSFGIFTTPIGSGYTVYSYNFNTTNNCGLPVVNTPITIIDCNVIGTCGELTGPFPIEACCTAITGIPIANVEICPLETISVTVTGFEVTNNQSILLIGSMGIIEEINSGGNGDFTADMSCPNSYQVCSYNYDSNAVFPTVGLSLTALDCSITCCELQCISINVNDAEAPVFMNAPSDISVDCIGEVPPLTSLVWSDNCDETGMTLGMETGNVDCMGGTLIRTWAHTDACGNSSEWTQSITVAGIPIATFQNPPPSFELDCGETLPAITDLIYDNGLTGVCQDVGMISGMIEDFSNGCTGFAVYSWSGADNCGNPLIHTRTISYIVPCAAAYNLLGAVSSVADYESSGTITSSQTIESSANVDYDSSTDIQLNAGFEVILGAVFDAFIDGCNNGEGGGVNLHGNEELEKK